jgi:hypothetical protein
MHPSQLTHELFSNFVASVIASSKNTYELRYFLVDEPDAEEDDDA